jgi:hypothetical protein
MGLPCIPFLSEKALNMTTQTWCRIVVDAIRRTTSSDTKSQIA